MKMKVVVSMLLLCVVGAASRSTAQGRVAVLGADGPQSAIGVTVAELTDAVAGRAKVTSGVVIESVRPQSPAERAGFRAGDVVVDFDGERVRSVRQFTRLVQESRPGRAIDATVARDTARQTLTVTPELGRATGLRLDPGAPQLQVAPFAFDWESFPRNGWFAPAAGRLGAAVMPLDDQLAQYFGVSDGVLVTSVAADTPAGRAGLRAGDVIVEIAGRQIGDAQDVTEAVRSAAPGSPLTIDIVRDKKRMLLEVQLPAPRRPAAVRAPATI